MPHVDQVATMAEWAAVISKIYTRKTRSHIQAFDAYHRYRQAKALLHSKSEITSLTALRAAAAKQPVDYFDLQNFRHWVPNLLIDIITYYRTSITLHDGVVLYNCPKEDVFDVKHHIQQHYPEVSMALCCYTNRGLKQRGEFVPKGYDFLIGLQTKRSMENTARDIVDFVLPG